MVTVLLELLEGFASGMEEPFLHGSLWWAHRQTTLCHIQPQAICVQSTGQGRVLVEEKEGEPLRQTSGSSQKWWLLRSEGQTGGLPES